MSISSNLGKDWYYYVIVILSIVIFVMFITKDNTNIQPQLLIKDSIKENINKDIILQNKFKDSVISLLSGKTNPIYVTNIYKQNELENKNIANYSITITDSIFKQNLLSAHRQYDYLFDTIR